MPICKRLKTVVGLRKPVRANFCNNLELGVRNSEVAFRLTALLLSGDFLKQNDLCIIPALQQCQDL
jgi:hypothetical protein